MSFKEVKKSKYIYTVFYLNTHIFTVPVLFIYFYRFELPSFVISSHPEGLLLVFIVKTGLLAMLFLRLFKPGSVFIAPSFFIVLLDIGFWVDFFFYHFEHVLPLASLVSVKQ